MSTQFSLLYFSTQSVSKNRAVVESVSSSLTSPPSSPFSSMHSGAGSGQMPVSASNSEEYPLGRVLSARRSAATRSYTLPSSSSHEFIPPFNSPKQTDGPGTLLWGMRQRSSSTSIVESTEADQFMSWEPQTSTRTSWPRTISL